jgi:hypothetical protein
MYDALIAACCTIAGFAPPLAQNWVDTTLIARDDDWSRVPAMVGYRGDGLAPEPGTDPRRLTADGSGTPVDVTANRARTGEIGLAAGVAEFELTNPVVALHGSATASAPQLVMALDTRGRSKVSVRLTLRDIDGTADAVEPVAVQYRVGRSGAFANVAGGYVADATGADPGRELVTPVAVTLPAAAENRPLVEVRVLTTDAIGRDEWVGIDDIAVTAETATAPGDCGGPAPGPGEPGPGPDEPVPGGPGPGPPAPNPYPSETTHPRITGLSLTPASFAPAKRGAAVSGRGRAGAALRFRLSEPATVRFRVTSALERLRFQVRGRRGLNGLRFSGRIRGRPLHEGAYVLTAVATGRKGADSAPATTRFAIEPRRNLTASASRSSAVGARARVRPRRSARRSLVSGPRRAPPLSASP